MNVLMLNMGFVTALALLIDIEGGRLNIFYQITYFIPAISVLCLAASVTLRRKGYGKAPLSPNLSVR